MILYKEQNIEDEPPFVEASLYDVCDWIIENYPEDIFDGSSGEKGSLAIAQIRVGCKKILRMRK